MNSVRTPRVSGFALLPFESQPMSWHRDDFEITTDRNRFNFEELCTLLVNESDWAEVMSSVSLQRGVAASIAFVIFHGRRQIGLARAVTDGESFAYVRDVIVSQNYSGRGLGVWLMQCVCSHPDLLIVSRWMLSTTDAHALYQKFGFAQVAEPELLMTRRTGERD